ncbi:HVO_0234 family beta-propeller protein [Haloarchaeobius sp. TZWWS8]|uniref:HVO_0234 family beta-propeller protein n=1 Tax=Haloarchaeobius sp. TZWWS8 TaxID=3446121 RepID=UPI003EBD751B
MSAEKDITLDEKRVYRGDQRERHAFVACELGVVRVEVVEERVGGFELAHRCEARDVAAGPGGTIAVATSGGVLLAGVDDEFRETGFPAEHAPATAVGFDGDDLLAAAEDGTVARLADAATNEDGDGGWTTVDTTLSAVRAVDGDLLATEAGVYRALADDLEYVGLDDARDVSLAGVPRAATADGLYYLGNGWMDDLPGEFRLVSDDGTRAHAATPDTLYELTDGSWRVHPHQLDGHLAGLVSGSTTYAVTENGEFLAEAEDGWRTQVLGMPGVCGLAVRLEE